MHTVAPTRDYTSIGQLAARLQQSVRTLESAACELGITPAMALNGIVYFDGVQVELILRRLNES